jgi:hypothetical protein
MFGLKDYKVLCPLNWGILDLGPIARRASAVSRFDTMPSRPSLHACWNTGGAIPVSVFVELDAGGSLRQRLRQLGLAVSRPGGAGMAERFPLSPVKEFECVKTDSRWAAV